LQRYISSVIYSYGLRGGNYGVYLDLSFYEYEYYTHYLHDAS
jgi:hypothetical protein